MPNQQEQDLKRLAADHTGEPIVAGGSFKVVVGAHVRGLIMTPISWMIRKHLAGLPLYPYIAITKDEIVVLEFEFLPELRLRREWRRWRFGSVDIVGTDPARFKLVLRPPNGRLLTLEGLYKSQAERDLVQTLAEVAEVG